MKRTLEFLIEMAVKKAVMDALFPGFVSYSSIIAELILWWPPKGIDRNNKKFYTPRQDADIHSKLKRHHDFKQGSRDVYYTKHRVR